MISQTRPITKSELASLLRMQPRTLERKLPVLQAGGMPVRLPGTKVWPREAIENWLRGRPPIDEAYDPVAEARRMLEARIVTRQHGRMH